MADPTPASTAPAPQNAAPKPPPPPKPQNPALRMLGLPNIKFKLPSRNWLIFLSITGSFATALIYDRRKKRQAQEKWSNLVAHIAKEPLRTNEARRKLTIYLSAPPGDGLRSAREYFKEYVKPVLVAGAMDYEVLEGRREGDIRAAIASRIRKTRRQAGESAPIEEDEADNFLRQVRQNFGIEDEPVIKGEMVIGRHTWKEYIRGVHEGWLGPVDPPAPAIEPTPEVPKADETSAPATTDDGSPIAQEQPDEKKEAEKKPEEKKPEKKPTKPTTAYIFPSSYPSQPLSPTAPQEIDVSPIAFPHILGFLNTPIRIYRFLTQRYLADAIGRDIAAIVLASSTRPFTEDQNRPESEFAPANTIDNTSPTSSEPQTSHHYEQQSLLEQEEKEWHKSVRKQKEDPEIKEREWLDDIVLDPRIASRMRRFDLLPEEEERAQRIAEGKEWVRGEEKPEPVPVWKWMWNTYGFGEEEDPRRKVIIGNLDGEDGE
ncbi:mitochondrial import inner membrane translocase subunit tim54 [Onygenales sp. PD_12]|nr:mitochondrial import inner membrane translocase subunit tim54 [Onygenales sp. PD_12]